MAMRSGLLAALGALLLIPLHAQGGVASAAPVLPFFQGTPGLLGEYFQGAAAGAAPADPPGTPTITYTDGPIAFTDRGATDPWAVAWKAGFGPTTYMARWTGWVLGPITGPVTFKVGGDDHTALYLNGTLQPNYYWAGRGYPATPETNTVNMVQGEWMSIKLLYAQGTGNRVVRLFWSYTGVTDVNIPTTNLNQNPPGPSAPTLSGTAPPANNPPRIDLTWTTPTGTPAATGYIVSRSTVNGGPYATVATLPGGTNSWTDNNLVFGTTYYYVVQGTSNNGQFVGTASNQVALAPQAPPPRTQTVGSEDDECGCGVTRVPGMAALAAWFATALALRLLCLRRACRKVWG